MKTKVVNRIFYINVSNLTHEKIPKYIEMIRDTIISQDDELSELKKIHIWEDIFIPVETGETRIEIVLVDLENPKIHASHMPLDTSSLLK